MPTGHVLKLAQRQLVLLTILGLAALTVVPVGPVPKASGLSADFALSAFPSSLTLGQGATSSSTVTVTGRGGYQGNVSLSIAEVYDSLHVGVQPTPSLVQLNMTHQSANSILTISVSAYAVPGSYFIDVESYDGVVSHQTQIALTVTGQDFAISSSPSRLDFPPSENKTLNTTVTVSSLGDFSGMVSLTMSVEASYPVVPQIPSASPSKENVSITPSAAASFQLAISVNSSMVAHQYNVQITGVAATTAGVSHGIALGVVIGPDFNMSMATRNLVVHQGAMLVSSITFSSINGFTGMIGAYSGLIAVNPPNPEIDLHPPDPVLIADGTNTSRIVVKTDSRTGLGTYSIGIEASDVTNCCLGEFLPYTLTVLGPLAGPDFAMYADPAHISTSLSSTVGSTINLIGENGFNGRVTLFTSIGSSASLNPVSVIVSPTVNVTSTLTLSIPGPTPGGGGSGWWFASGSYPVLVIATDPTGFAHEAWVNVTATPFSLIASPARQELKANSTTTFDLTVNSIGGFNDTMTLAARAPQPFTSNLSKGLLNFSAAPSSLSSKITVNVPTRTPDGDYVIQITATYMRPRYICSCAPKDALSYTVSVHVIVTSTTGSSTILGLQPVVFYSAVAATMTAVAIAASYLALRGRKRVRAGQSRGASNSLFFNQEHQAM